MRAKINLYNEDCLQAMKAMQDNEYDLAIVDPPYGIDAVNSLNTVTGGKKHTAKDWDKETPTKEYFDELFRVSKNQIIWGANYFMDKMPLPTKCWVVWDKNNGESSFADGELAWTSFDKNVSIIKSHWCGSAAKWETGQNKIHPTQKPEKLYRWLLEKYAEKGNKILDTHLGSGSIANACWDMGYDLDAYEIDKEYYNKTCKRFEVHSKQMQLW